LEPCCSGIALQFEKKVATSTQLGVWSFRVQKSLWTYYILSGVHKFCGYLRATWKL
jgi:hypothetical protein